VPSERLAGSGRNGWPGAVGIRSYHDELAQRATLAHAMTTTAAREDLARTVGPIRSLVDWLLSPVDEPFAAAFEDAHAVDTTPHGERPPVSRERLLSRAPTPAPPGSVQPIPWELAAGPVATVSRTRTPRNGDEPTTLAADREPLTADPCDSGERRGLGSALAAIEAQIDVPKDVEDRIVAHLIQREDAARPGVPGSPAALDPRVDRLDARGFHRGGPWRGRRRRAQRNIHRANTFTLIVIDDHSHYVVGHGVDAAYFAIFATTPSKPVQ